MKRTLTLLIAMLMCMSTMVALPAAATGTESSAPVNVLTGIAYSNLSFADGVHTVGPVDGLNELRYQPVELEPQSTYTLSFEMKNKVADPLWLYMDCFSNEAEEDKGIMGNVETLLRGGGTHGHAFGIAREGDAASVWHTYRLSIPVPALNKVTFSTRFIFAADADTSMRNISLAKTDDSCVSTINGTFDGNSSWTAYDGTMEYAEEEDGNRYLKLSPNARFTQTPIYVPTDSTLRLSFRMKNSVKNCAGILAGSAHMYPLAEVSDSVAAHYDNVLGGSYGFKFGSAKTGDAIHEWEWHQMDIPVPIAERRAMTQINLCIRTYGDDPHLAFDDVTLTLVNDKCNFLLNGDFEQGSYDVTKPHPAASTENGWFFLLDGTDHVPNANGRDQGGIKEDASGNRYLHVKNWGANLNCAIRNDVTPLAPGRYKLSFKVKLQDTTQPLKVTFSQDLSQATQDGYLNGIYENRGGISMPVSASFTDDWETKNIYFSVQTQFTPCIYLPAMDTNIINEYMFDDITLTRDDESSLTFTESKQETGIAHATAGNVIKIETVKGNAVTSLSAAGNTIPVNFHYVSEKETAEKMYMIAALYSVAEDGTKKVESIDVKYGETVIDSVTGGKNANGIINLSASLIKPAALNERSYVSVMVIDAVTLQPVYVQTNLSY